MKILQIITLSELGGAQSVVINLANALSKQHEVMVAAGEGDGKMWDMLDETVRRYQCKYLQRAISPFKELQALIELRKIYNDFKPDIIHLHSSKAGLLGRVILPTKKIVYTVHGFDSIRVAHRKMLPLEKFMRHFCYSIVGVSKYDFNNLCAEGIDRNVSVVYNAINPPKPNSVNKPEIINKYKRIILSIARVAPPKRHDLFIELSKRFPEYGFVWIGNQDPIYDLPENCHFLGNIPNAGAYCQYADVFCLMSDFEGLPMVILEAMSFGKPIVASKVGGIQEIVKDGVNGYTVDNDINQFIDKVNYILSDDKVQSNMGEKSKEIFNNELTIEKMVGGYMSIYEEILSN